MVLLLKAVDNLGTVEEMEGVLRRAPLHRALEPDTLGTAGYLGAAVEKMEGLARSILMEAYS